MTDPKALSVTILDKEYRIACPPNEEATLRQAARYLDEKMQHIQKIGRIVGLDRVAVMAALNIAHELLTSRQSQGTSDFSAFEDRLQRLNQKLTHTLNRLPEEIVE